VGSHGRGWHDRLLTRARERRLEKVAAAYAIAGWVAVQVAAIALPAFHAPDWLLRWLIAAALIGFPAALAIAWIWNRKRSKAVAHLSRLDVALLSTIAVVALLTVGELAWRWSSDAPAQEAPSTLAPAEGSIAVLPFANTSGDPNQRYFGEGISDELIGLLARNPALRVAARTSAYAFEGKSEDVRTVAQKLNVRAVLEGSVRTENGRVRIEANLINAADGYEVWSQSYDRSLGDILLVQADIAEAITKALVPRLLHEKSTAPQAHAIDPAAYRLYLEGLVYMEQRREDAETEALPLLRKAVQLAPDFAAAQATLAYDLNLVAGSTHQPGLDPERDAALAKALSLDPTNPRALSLSIALALQDRNWDKAIDLAIILRGTNVHTVDAIRGVTDVYGEFGLNALQLAAWQEAVRLDPLSYNARMNLADTYFALSRNGEAIETVREALKLSPGNPHGTADLCEMLASTKQIAAAKAVRESMVISGAARSDLDDCAFLIALSTGDKVTAMRIADNARTHFPGNGLEEFDVAFYLAGAGDLDQSLIWFTRAADKGQDVFSLTLVGHPFEKFFRPAFFQNPRWIALTKRGAYQAWAAARVRALREFSGG